MLDRSSDVVVASPEEAYDNEAEFWQGNELIGVTLLHEGRLHLRIDPEAINPRTTLSAIRAGA